VYAIFAEAWSHRKYPESFISKLVDSKGETTETEGWIDFATAHCYVDEEKQKYFLLKLG
jgi:hypothetical protein